MKRVLFSLAVFVIVAVSGCERPDDSTDTAASVAASPTPSSMPVPVKAERPELVIPKEQDWDVRFISFSADNRTLIVGGGAYSALTGTVWFWDLKTGRLKQVFAGGKSPVAISPDGRKLVTGSPDVKLWQVSPASPPPRLLKKKKRHWTEVMEYQFSPDGKVFVSAGDTDGESQDGIERTELWDAASGRLLKTLKPAGQPVTFSPDGSTLATWGGDWSIRNGGRGPGSSDEVSLWDVKRRRLKRTFLAGISWISDLDFSPSGESLAVSGGESIELHNAQSGRLLKTLKYEESAVGEVAYLPDGQTIVSSSEWSEAANEGEPNELRWWNVHSGQITRTIKSSPQAILALAASSDGRFVAGGNKRIHLWDARTGKLLLTFSILPPVKGQKLTSNWIAATPDGYFVGTPQSSQFIQWRIGGKSQAGQSQAQIFHRPDLVEKMLAVVPPRSSTPQSSVKAAPALTERDLQGKSNVQLDLMRNEIFARRGRRFQRNDLQKHFSAQSWYKPRADYNDGMLSQQEKQNAEFILKYQRRNGN